MISEEEKQQARAMGLEPKILTKLFLRFLVMTCKYNSIGTSLETSQKLKVC